MSDTHLTLSTSTIFESSSSILSSDLVDFCLYKIHEQHVVKMNQKLFCVVLGTCRNTVGWEFVLMGNSLYNFLYVIFFSKKLIMGFRRLAKALRAMSLG